MKADLLVENAYVVNNEFQGFSRIFNDRIENSEVYARSVQVRSIIIF